MVKKMTVCPVCGKELPLQGAHVHIKNCKKPETNKEEKTEIEETKEPEDDGLIEKFLFEESEGEITKDDEDSKPLPKNFLGLILIPSVLVLVMVLISKLMKSPKQEITEIPPKPILGKNLNQGNLT